jgi:hypothetical protein
MNINNGNKKQKPVKFFAFLVLIMVFSVFGAFSAYSQTAVSDWEDEDFPNNSRQTVELNASDGGNGSGEATVETSKDEDGAHKVKITLDVQTQPDAGEENMAYQAWLMDEDSGYNLSMGVMIPDSENTQNGQSAKTLEFRQRMPNFSIYDKVAVTLKDLNDDNPEPGKMVFEGDIPEITASNTKSGGMMDRDGGRMMDQNQQQISGEINIENANWFRANLNSEGLQDSNSSAMGMGVLLQDRDNNIVRYVVDTNNLEGEIREIHVYRSSENIESQEPVLELPTDGDPVRGQLNYSDSEEDSVMLGMSYIVVKTDKYPNGEIAGSFEEVEVQSSQ